MTLIKACLPNSIKNKSLLSQTVTRILSFEITVKLQWLEHLLNHENMFATVVVQASVC